MLDKLFGSPAHEHPDPAQRLIGVAALPPDSTVLLQLLGTDPAADVRAAAARRCADATALAAALQAEAEPTVRAALATSLGAQLAQDDERRRITLDAIGDEEALVDVALEAELAAVRLAAAERVHAP